MSKNQYDVLARFIEYTQEQLNVHVYVKDYVDFILLDDELTQALGNYLAHNSPYCRYIKSDGNRYIKCTSMMDGIIRRLSRAPVNYCGVCHAGVKEYICPIISGGRLIGTVHAGDFAVEERYVCRFLSAAGEGAELDRHKALELYRANMQQGSPDTRRLKFHLEIIALTLATIFSRAAGYGDYSPLKQDTVLFHNRIIANSIEFLQQHYTEDLRVRDVAEHCNCSVSCLSHLFKSRIGMSFSVYLTKLRLDEARRQLTDTSLSIAEIAANCGFSDPNYFTRVFTRSVGLTPRQMRKRFSE